MLLPYQIGINVNNGATLAPPITSYANTGGSGNRAGVITASSSITPDGGLGSYPITNLFDGVTANTTGWDLPGTGSTAIADGDYWRFDFGSKKYIDEMEVYFGTDFTIFNMGTWAFAGSDSSGSGYTNYASVTWNTAKKQVVTLTGVPAQGFRYWQWVKVGAGSNFYNDWLEEFRFKIADGA